MNEKSVENVIAAVEHRDRISHISISEIYGFALQKLAAAMQQPLPTLEYFLLQSYDESVPVLPEAFLGGSAPLLERFGLFGIPLPTFPKFIVSSTHIRDLFIDDIPHSGYISPNSMVACLAALPNLEDLSIHDIPHSASVPPNTMVACLAALPNLEVLLIGFHFTLSLPPRITLPRTRIVLPTLIDLSFSGDSEYFEDFATQIDTPLLNELHVTFFMDHIFDIPQLRHFVGCTERLKPLDQARMEFSDVNTLISVGLCHQTLLEIRYEGPDWQLSSIEQIFGQQLPLLSHVEQLQISQHHQENIERMDNPDMESSLWLELFHLFITLQRLYVSAKLVAPVAAALELTEGRTMEVLPALHSIFLEGLEPSGPVPEGINLTAI